MLKHFLKVCFFFLIGSLTSNKKPKHQPEQNQSSAVGEILGLR